MEHLLFYIFSGAMIFFSLLTITRRNPVDSAMCLILVFFFMAGLFVLLHAYFLAAVQVLVYAGAVMVLFLFVIMLLNLPAEEKRRLHWFGALAVLLAAPLLILEFVAVLRRSDLAQIRSPIQLEGLTESVGRLLFSQYLLPFEITSILLLVAMIGVVVLSKKEPGS